MVKEDSGMLMFMMLYFRMEVVMMKDLAENSRARQPMGQTGAPSSSVEIEL